MNTGLRYFNTKVAFYSIHGCWCGGMLILTSDIVVGFGQMTIVTSDDTTAGFG